MSPQAQALQKQLQQLRASHAAGSIPEARFNQERTALERKLLDALAEAPVGGAAAGRGPRRVGVQTWALLGVLVAAVAAAGYGLTGSPQMINALPSDMAQAGAAGGDGSHDMSADQMAELVGRLAERMKANPEDAEGWMMLGRSYAAMGRGEEALSAFTQLVKLRPNDPGALTDFADALAVQNGRTLEGEPLKLIEKALRIDPQHVKALALAGTAAFNREDYAKAVEYWDTLVRTGPADNPIVEMARGGAEEARARGKLPPGALAAAPAPTGTPPAAPSATAAPTTATPTGPQATAAAGKATVSGTVDLSADLRAQAKPDDVVLIFARAAEGSRMPLALMRTQVKDLPFSFTLDETMAMSPAATLASTQKVIVGARVSKSGQPMPQPGDLEGLSSAVPVGGQGVKVVISQTLK
jgi:cytochrome c-type biogenesis protein CcmH